MPTPSQPKELTPEQQGLLEVARACGERQLSERTIEASRAFTASLQVFRDADRSTFANTYAGTTPPKPTPPRIQPVTFLVNRPFSC